MSRIDELLAAKGAGDLDNPIETVIEDYRETSIEQYRKFNENSWSAGTGYMLPNKYKFFNEAMEGLQSGMYLLAAESNAGKSAILLDLIIEYSMLAENKLFGIYFSLDDTEDKLIPRILASRAKVGDATGAPISLFSKPQRYLNELRDMIEHGEEDTDKARTYYSYLYKDIIGTEEAIDTDIINTENPPSLEEYPDSIYAKAYQWLDTTRNTFKIVDGTKIHNGEQLIDYCKKVQDYIRIETGDQEWNVIVGIDSLSDITWETQRFNSDKEMNDYTSRTVKQWAVEDLKCPIFGSIHLRKIDQRKRPTIADVKESGRWVYESTIVFTVHNDMSRNGDLSNIHWYYHDAPMIHYPVLEVHWAKNKQSSFKGYTFFKFEPDFSRVFEPATKEESDAYISAVYDK